MASSTSIKVTFDAWCRMRAYTNLCATEVSGFAHFNVATRTVDKIYPLLSQRCHGAETEMDTEALAAFYMSKAGRDANAWWHSHVNMGAYFSGGDKDTIDKMVRHMPFLVSIVMNKSAQYQCRIDVQRPIRMTLEDVALDISQPPIKTSILEMAHRELAQKVRGYGSIVEYNKKNGRGVGFQQPGNTSRTDDKDDKKIWIKMPVESVTETLKQMMIEKNGYKLSDDGKFLIKERQNYGQLGLGYYPDDGEGDGFYGGE